jgi:hypothetical protein
VDVDGTVSPGTLLAQYSDPVVTGLAANNWLASGTANGAVDLGTGTGVGTWQAITGLTVSPQASPLGGVLTAAIALYCVNKTATYGGSISIGFGIDAADPLDIHVESKSIPADYSGYVDMDIRRVTTETALTGTETLQVYARINSGEHVSFGVDVRGDLHASSAVLDYLA